MQSETPAPTKKQKQRNKKRMKQSKSTTRGTMLSNPYQNVPVKSNSPGPDKNGFMFPGGIV